MRRQTGFPGLPLNQNGERERDDDSAPLTATMECAFSVASFFNTRSTACAAVSFWNFSRIVAAVKSVERTESNADYFGTSCDTIQTSQSSLIAAQGLESSGSPVKGLDVIRVLPESIVAVCHDSLILWRGHVHITWGRD